MYASYNRNLYSKYTEDKEKESKYRTEEILQTAKEESKKRIKEERKTIKIASKQLIKWQ